MKFAPCSSFLLLLAACEATATAVTPVQKVIALLGSMLEKGKKEKHAEQVQFASYKQFCEDTSTQKSRDIKQSEEQIAMLTADIKKYKADVDKLGNQVSELEADIAVWNGDVKAATKVRHIEKTEYEKTHKDYSESIVALQNAVQALKKQARDVKVSFSQTSGGYSAEDNLLSFPPGSHRVIDAFLSQEVDVEDTVDAAPAANAYEFQSRGIVEMLEKLTDKFVDERTTLEKEEMSSKHAYDIMMQDLKSQISEGTADRGQKAQKKAKTLQLQAEAKGDLMDTTNTRDEDQKYLAELTSECRSKGDDFENRQDLRAQEIAAIEKAVAILSSGAVKGNSEKYLAAFSQKKSSFGQLRARTFSPAQIKATFYLQRQARELNSRVLSTVALHVQDDPFLKVKKLIKDLIVRLMEEANEEAEHKGWCDTELATNKQTRKEKTEEVETLHAEIDELKASIAGIGEDLAALSKGITELDKAMATSTKLRQKEKAENTETTRDAQEAQTAVAQALVVLHDFYAKSADATSFTQTGKQKPEIFDTPYKGMGGTDGVIGMLEVIESDFARLEAETSAAEATSQRAYAAFMSDSKQNKAVKTKSSEHKVSKKQDMEQALNTKQSDLEGTQKELDAALQFFDKLKPSCVDAGVSYEDRVGRRKEEIESLQEALRILNGESV